MKSEKDHKKQEELREESVYENEIPVEGEKTSEETAQDAEAEENEPTLEERLAQANEQIEQLQDKYLRQVAEFDNYRKRTIKEKAELVLNGGEKVMTALLPVLDDLERAQANMAKSTDVETLREGVELIIDKLGKALAAQGLKPIDTTDAAFDTDFHEAIAMVPVEDETQKGKVIDCVQTGYLLNEKVLRHAKVAVGQ